MIRRTPACGSDRTRSGPSGSGSLAASPCTASLSTLRPISRCSTGSFHVGFRVVGSPRCKRRREESTRSRKWPRSRQNTWERCSTARWCGLIRMRCRNPGVRMRGLHREYLRRRDREARRKDKHTDLGLKEEDLVEMFRIMLLARYCDERQWALNRQGKAPFVVPVSGHEGAQVGSAWAFERGKDVFCPYYRDLALRSLPGSLPKMSSAVSSGRRTTHPPVVDRCRPIGARAITTSSPVRRRSLRNAYMLQVSRW